MIAPGNGDAPAREFAVAAPTQPPREVDMAPPTYQAPAYQPPAYEPPAYQPPPPAPSAPAGDAESGQPAKPAPTYSVWSSSPGDGQPLGPKE